MLTLAGGIVEDRVSALRSHIGDRRFQAEHLALVANWRRDVKRRTVKISILAGGLRVHQLQRAIAGNARDQIADLVHGHTEEQLAVRVFLLIPAVLQQVRNQFVNMEPLIGALNAL